MRIGVIDVGGGMRDAFGAGVYEYCEKNGIHFDYAAGISAGAMNLTSFLAGESDSLYKCYAEYAFDKRYMSFSNFIKNHAYANIGWMMHDVRGPHGYMPLDFSKMLDCGTEFEIVATGAYTGKPIYMSARDMEADNCWCVIASATLPVVSSPYMHDDRMYYDGGLSDPIPLKRCFKDKDCDKVVLILTRPRDYERKPEKDRRMAALIRTQYPGGARALAGRAAKYNKELALAKRLEEEGRVLILAPDDIGGMSAMTRDKDMIIKLYEKGLNEAEKIKGFISQII